MLHTLIIITLATCVACCLCSCGDQAPASNTNTHTPSTSPSVQANEDKLNAVEALGGGDSTRKLLEQHDARQQEIIDAAEESP